MPLTRDFMETVHARAQRDTTFREGLLREGFERLLAGDVDAGKIVLLYVCITHPRRRSHVYSQKHRAREG